MYDKYDTFDEVYKWLYNNVSINMKLHPKTDFNKQEKIMYEAFAIGFLELLKERDKVIIAKLKDVGNNTRKALEELEEGWLDKTKPSVMFTNDWDEVIEEGTTIEVNYPEKRCSNTIFNEDVYSFGALMSIDFTTLETFTKTTPQSDLIIKEIWADNQGAWSVSPPRGVCITHRPTGISVTHTSNRSVFGNKNDGLEALRQVLQGTYHELYKKLEVKRYQKEEV